MGEGFKKIPQGEEPPQNAPEDEAFLELNREREDRDDKGAEGGNDAPSLAELGNTYSDALAATAAAENTANELDALRASLDLPGDDTINDNNPLAKMEGKLEKMEQAFLAYPEGGTDAGDMKQEVKAMTQEINELSKEAREQMIEQYIQSSIEKILRPEGEIGSFVDTCENKEKAIQLIQQKARLEIQNQAKTFIESGEEVALDFEAEASGQEIEASGEESNEPKTYLTKFDITFNSPQLSQ